ncbi:type 4a pilus biogenesis protein PilO [Candidatus Fermentibacterales bacterium]|nr:type 4a pilus biogenesis protein PilO [Candidatus Fermentibacterales bacterium]
MAGIDIRDPRLLRVILGLVLLAVVVYVYFNFIVKGVQDSITEAEDTYRMRETQLETLQQQTTEDMAMMSQRIEQYEQELERLDRFLPRSYSQEEVLQMLADKADNSGLQILSLSPMPASAQGEYTSYDWQVHLVGRYHRLGVFLDQLTQQAMMTAVEDLEIHQMKAAEGKFDNIEATFTFSAFVAP